MTQLETAMYWIEYVIRHDGAPHLRSATQNLTWYQIYLLDVFAFLAVVVLTFFFIVYKLLKCLKNCLCRGKKEKNVSSLKKNK